MMSAPKRDIRPQPPHLRTEFDRVVSQMPPLHSLQDRMVAGLKRQVQMRHQPFVGGDDVEQVAVGLDRIDRGDAQALQLRHMP